MMNRLRMLGYHSLRPYVHLSSRDSAMSMTVRKHHHPLNPDRASTSPWRYVKGTIATLVHGSTRMIKEIMWAGYFDTVSLWYVLHLQTPLSMLLRSVLRTRCGINVATEVTPIFEMLSAEPTWPLSTCSRRLAGSPLDSRQERSMGIPSPR